MKRLNKLQKDTSAILKKISLPNEIKERLHCLGVIEGLPIKFIKKAPLGDPSVYHIMNSYIAIRKNLAENMFVEEIIKDGK